MARLMPRDWPDPRLPPEPRFRWWHLILPAAVTLAGAVSLLVWLARMIWPAWSPPEKLTQFRTRAYAADRARRPQIRDIRQFPNWADLRPVRDGTEHRI
jgi:hypothetical protein